MRRCHGGEAGAQRDRGSRLAATIIEQARSHAAACEPTATGWRERPPADGGASGLRWSDSYQAATGTDRATNAWSSTAASIAVARSAIEDRARASKGLADGRPIAARRASVGESRRAERRPLEVALGEERLHPCHVGVDLAKHSADIEGEVPRRDVAHDPLGLRLQERMAGPVEGRVGVARLGAHPALEPLDRVCGASRSQTRRE